MAPPLTNAQLAAATTGGAPPGGPVQSGTPTTDELRDAIVLRGYLEDPGMNAPGGQVWRLNLTARHDQYVDFVAADALRVVPYAPSDPDPLDDAVTLWLAGRDANCCPKRYFLSSPLLTASGFLAGVLVNDYLENQGLGGPTYPEQGYGGLGGRTPYCSRTPYC